MYAIDRGRYILTLSEMKISNCLLYETGITVFWVMFFYFIFFILMVARKINEYCKNSF